MLKGFVSKEDDALSAPSLNDVPRLPGLWSSRWTPSCV